MPFVRLPVARSGWWRVCSCPGGFLSGINDMWVAASLGYQSSWNLGERYAGNKGLIIASHCESLLVKFSKIVLSNKGKMQTDEQCRSVGNLFDCKVTTLRNFKIDLKPYSLKWFFKIKWESWIKRVLFGMISLISFESVGWLHRRKKC